MQEYIESHSEKDSSRLFHCPVVGCVRSFTSCPGLRYHMKTHSGPERPYACPRCHKEFKSFNGLKYHTAKTRCVGDQPENHVIDLTQSDDSCEDLSDEGEVIVEGERMDVTEAVPPDKNYQVQNDPENSSITHRRFVERSLPLLTIKTSPVKVNPSMQSFNYTTIHAEMVERTTITDHTPHNIHHSHNMHHSPHNLHHTQSIDQNHGHVTIDSVHTETDHAMETNFATECNYNDSNHVGDGLKQDSLSGLNHSITTNHGSESNRLIELANIATSPLILQNRPLDPLRSPTLHSPNGDLSPPLMSPVCSHLWPRPVWRCFLKDVNIKFAHKPDQDWILSQDLATNEASNETMTDTTHIKQRINKELRLLSIDPSSDLPPDKICLHFTNEGHQIVTAQCPVSHPFYVKHKGWSAYNPSLAQEHHTIPCHDLSIGDVCLDSPTQHNHFWYDFSPMDSNAALTLSTMAQKKKHDSSSPTKPNGFCSSPTKCDATKVKRPMNGFMLFAKKFRVELTQKHPGKDNRTISIMLGEMWQAMSSEEKETYAHQARELAEEQRRLNPDCWKRRKNSEQ